MYQIDWKLGNGLETAEEMLLSIQSVFLLRSHVDASARQTETGGGELFEKFQQKQKIIKDNTTAGGSQMGGKR